jgi:hypothetical protein
LASWSRTTSESGCKRLRTRPFRSWPVKAENLLGLEMGGRVDLPGSVTITHSMRGRSGSRGHSDGGAGRFHFRTLVAVLLPRWSCHRGSRLDPAYLSLNDLDALPGAPYQAFPFQHWCCRKGLKAHGTRRRLYIFRFTNPNPKALALLLSRTSVGLACRSPCKRSARG